MFRILFVAHSNERKFQQPDDRGQYFLSWQPGASEVLLDSPTNHRQSATEVNHALILSIVTDFSPTRMVAVLFSAFGISPSRLKMPV